MAIDKSQESPVWIECHVLRESFTWQVFHKNYYCLATLTKPVLEFKVILELVFIF
jgi:hypothetical protein